jgi:hypothetical protein
MIIEASPLREEVERHIRKLIKPLQKEELLKKVLKTRLTKKEFKVLSCWAYNENLEVLLERLALDTKRYELLKDKIIKKLNQEKLKQEIMI